MNYKFWIEELTLAKLNKLSVSMAEMVLEKGYEIEHVLYIERAGLFVGNTIAKYFDCTISGIHASRSGGVIKSRTKIFLKFFPRCFKNFLRRIEIYSNFHKIKNDRHVKLEETPPPKGKKVLIVDDAIDTGLSIKSTYDFLIKKGFDPQKIKTAVLTTTSENPIFRADISVFNKKIFVFPWSCDSKEYNVTWQLYKETKSSLC